MRALVISDTHFGAWTGRDLLREEFFLERLAPRLEGIDELIFLGDLFDFLFGSVEEAVDAADGLLRLIAEKMAGKRLVFLAGNHDHHLVHRDEDRLGTVNRRGARPAQDRGRPGRLLPCLPRAPPARGRDRDRLPDLQLRRRPLHPRPLPRPARPAQRLPRRPPADPDAVGDRRRRAGAAAVHRGLRVGDDPADRVALHRRPDAARHPRPAERLPRRAAGGPPRLGPQRPGKGREAAFSRASGPRLRRRRRCPRPSEAHFDAVVRDEAQRQAREQPLTGPAASRPIYPEPTVISRSDPSEHALEAFAQVTANLGWAGEAGKIVFAHTHQPLDDVRSGQGPAPATGTPAPGSTSPTSARARPTPATCATPGPAPRS